MRAPRRTTSLTDREAASLSVEVRSSITRASETDSDAAGGSRCPRAPVVHVKRSTNAARTVLLKTRFGMIVRPKLRDPDYSKFTSSICARWSLPL
jgi:hypothetical protein